MAKTKVKSYFQGGASFTNTVCAATAGALAWADAHMNTRSVAFSVSEVVPEPAALPAGYFRAQITCKTADRASLTFKVWLKATVKEAEIKTALLGTTWDGQLIDSVTVGEMEYVSLS